MHPPRARRQPPRDRPTGAAAPSAFSIVAGHALWQAGKVGVFTAGTAGLYASVATALCGADPAAYAGPFTLGAAYATGLGAAIGVLEAGTHLAQNALPRRLLPAVPDALEALGHLGTVAFDSAAATIKNGTVIYASLLSSAVAFADGVGPDDPVRALMGAAGVVSAAVLSAAWRMPRPTLIARR